MVERQSRCGSLVNFKYVYIKLFNRERTFRKVGCIPYTSMPTAMSLPSKIQIKGSSIIALGPLRIII